MPLIQFSNPDGDWLTMEQRKEIAAILETLIADMEAEEEEE